MRDRETVPVDTRRQPFSKELAARLKQNVNLKSIDCIVMNRSGALPEPPTAIRFPSAV